MTNADGEVYATAEFHENRYAVFCGAGFHPARKSLRGEALHRFCSAGLLACSLPGTADREVFASGSRVAR